MLLTLLRACGDSIHFDLWDRGLQSANRRDQLTRSLAETSFINSIASRLPKSGPFFHSVSGNPRTTGPKLDYRPGTDIDAPGTTYYKSPFVNVSASTSGCQLLYRMMTSIGSSESDPASQRCSAFLLVCHNCDMIVIWSPVLSDLEDGSLTFDIQVSKSCPLPRSVYLFRLCTIHQVYTHWHHHVNRC
jgi:hypothetical protein